MSRLIIFIPVLILIPILSWGLTFKSDGSVVDNDGNEIQSSRKNEEVDSNTKTLSQWDIKGIKFNISNSKVKPDVIFYKNGEEVGRKVEGINIVKEKEGFPVYRGKRVLLSLIHI